MRVTTDVRILHVCGQPFITQQVETLNPISVVRYCIKLPLPHVNLSHLCKITYENPLVNIHSEKMKNALAHIRAGLHRYLDDYDCILQQRVGSINHIFVINFLLAGSINLKMKGTIVRGDNATKV